MNTKIKTFHNIDDIEINNWIREHHGTVIDIKLSTCNHVEEGDGVITTIMIIYR